jgi:hypothetical protein
VCVFSIVARAILLTYIPNLSLSLSLSLYLSLYLSLSLFHFCVHVCTYADIPSTYHQLQGIAGFEYARAAHSDLLDICNNCEQHVFDDLLADKVLLDCPLCGTNRALQRPGRRRRMMLTNVVSRVRKMFANEAIAKAFSYGTDQPESELAKGATLTLH